MSDENNQDMENAYKAEAQVFGFQKLRQFIIGANRTNTELVQRRLVDIELADTQKPTDIFKYVFLGLVVFLIVMGSIIGLMKFTGDNSLAADNIRLNKDLAQCTAQLDQMKKANAPGVHNPQPQIQDNG